MKGDHVVIEIKVPRSVGLFLTYVARRLSESEDELIRKLLCDSLASLSSFMVREYAERWSRFLEEFVPDIERTYALTALATSFIAHYENPRFIEDIEWEARQTAAKGGERNDELNHSLNTAEKPLR